MRNLAAVPLIAAAALASALLFVSVSAQPIGQAGTPQSDLLLPPRVERVATKASLLYWGMPVANVEEIMGTPAEFAESEVSGATVRVLRYPLESIPTQVTILDRKVSGVAVDIAVTSERALPAYSRQVWIGMHRIAVLQMIGTPPVDRAYDRFGLHLEHMVFERAGQPDLSVFLINDRVVKKQTGRDLPTDIFSFMLPVTPNQVDQQAGAEGTKSVLDRIRIGIEMRDVEALFAAALMSVPYSFKGRVAEYRIYETGPGRPVECFTFVDGVLVEFAGWGRLPVDQILGGG